MSPVRLRAGESPRFAAAPAVLVTESTENQHGLVGQCAAAGPARSELRHPRDFLLRPVLAGTAGLRIRAGRVGARGSSAEGGMKRRVRQTGHTLLAAMILLVSAPASPRAEAAAPLAAGPAEWTGDLSPIAPGDWSYDRAAHLLERAGFGGTPEEIERLAAMTPAGGGRSTSSTSSDVDNSHLTPFDHSGVHDPGLEPFPASRPAATDLAKETGEALGVKVKPQRQPPRCSRSRTSSSTGCARAVWRPTASRTGGPTAWWPRTAPLEEKMALFWHGHFATNEDKVRDYRKMLDPARAVPEPGRPATSAI